MSTILKEKYNKEIVPALMKKFEIKNMMQVPRVEKIVINICVGKAASENNIKLLDTAAEELALISGQKPATTRSKKAISNFKLRAALLWSGPKTPCLLMVHRFNHHGGFGRFVLVRVESSERGDASALCFHAVDLRLPCGSLNLDIEPSSTLDEERRPPRLGGFQQIEEFTFKC